MAKLTFSGPTREADAESARAAAVLAGYPAHVHVIPAEQIIRVYTGADVVTFDPGKESVALTATISDGQLVFDAAASAAIKRAAVGTPSPAILYDDDVVFTATELIRAAGGYVKQIRCISGTATLDLYDSVDWAGRKLYTGTVSAGDVIDVNAIALNGVSAKVVGTVSISISHTEII